MNASERALASYLSEIKPRKIGFLDLYIYEMDERCIEMDLDASYQLFAPDCIFDDCDDPQATQFLESFLADDFSVSWTVSVQLSKLLSKRGHLVSTTMDRLLTSLNWSLFGGHQLFLSYLAVREDGASLARPYRPCPSPNFFLKGIDPMRRLLHRFLQFADHRPFMAFLMILGPMLLMALLVVSIL